MDRPGTQNRGLKCEECGERAVWAWQPQMANSPVYLCDDDAASMDLDELTELR